MSLEAHAVDVPTLRVRVEGELEQGVLTGTRHVGTVLVDELPTSGSASWTACETTTG